MRLNTNVVRKLAQASLSKGVFYEPRMYYDRLTFNATDIKLHSDPGVFRNNEKFPVRITDMIIYTSHADFNTITEDEKQLYLFELNLRALNTDYMSFDAIPFASWANKLTTSPLYLAEGSVTWNFQRPYILAQRDAMIVEGTPVTVPASNEARLAYVGFQGVGLQTGRPYLLDSQFFVSNAIPVGPFTMNPDNYRNDGVEPIAIHSVTASYAGGSQESSAIGNITDINFNIRQNGNGTNAPWFQGPVGIPALQACPGAMLGVNSGRAIVHQFPTTDENVQGMIWEPGQGVRLSINSIDLSSNHEDISFDVAFAGYIMVT